VLDFFNSHKNLEVTVMVILSLYRLLLYLL